MVDRALSSLRAWGLPFLLGAVSVFGFAPFYLFPLPILALAGLFWLLRADSPRLVFGRAYVFGLGWFLAGVSWVYVSLHDFGMMPAPVAVLATLLFCAFLALFPALALWLGLRWRGSGVVRWLLVVPAVWALLEWVRGWFLTGFPWQALGYAQAPWSPLVGYAPVLGVYGVSWLAALTAGALAYGRRWGWGLMVALWLLGHVLGEVAWTRPVGEPVAVALLQGNVPQELKFSPAKIIDTLRDYRRQILQSEARLIITPETAIPLFPQHLPEGYLAGLAEHARMNGGDVLLGMPEGELTRRYYNAMQSMGSAPQQSWRKRHLVPFGEFVPPGFGWIVNWLQIPLSDFSPGETRQAPMQVAGQHVAVNVCYEDVFGEELTDVLPEATLMANVSNDAWFGRSFAPWQHLQISQMRALESGRWWLRANNTGITAILDEKGQVRGMLAPFVTATLEGQAQGFEGATPYSRWGNAGFLILVFLVLAAAWVSSRGKR